MTQDKEQPVPSAAPCPEPILAPTERELEALQVVKPKAFRRHMRTAVVIAEVVFVLGLLTVWIVSDSIRHSKSLWVLFFYCFPSQFMMAAVPHEPVLLYFGKFYPAWIAALVATFGTVITELINYTVFKYVADLKAFQKMIRSRLVVRTVGLFRRAPFLSLWIAGATPIPFYPFRFLVVLAHYPLPLYILAVFTSRLPRFFVLAFLGDKFNIPDWVIIALFVVLVVMAVYPLVSELLRKNNNGDNDNARCSP